MLRRARLWRCVDPSDRLAVNGGLPFYGNLYQGRVNADDWQPSQYSTSQEARVAMLTFSRTYADDDPYIRAKMDKCPYFALCDLVVWHGMAPTFLDPGLLTTEEHHLLLLFSRAYYEKWLEIHSKPREVAPRPRIKKGRFEVSARLLKFVGADAHQIKKARDLLIDDASFAGMKPGLWSSAHLDEKVRDHLTGRCLEFIGLKERQMDELFEMLERMRSVVVKRRDKRAKLFALPGATDVSAKSTYYNEDDEDGYLTFSFKDASTLHDLHTLLGLPSYSGQLKCYNFVDKHNTEHHVSLVDEDTYFDLLIQSFFGARLEVPSGSTSPFVITVEAETTAEQIKGRVF